MKKIVVIIILFLSILNAPAQDSDDCFPFASQSERKALIAKLNDSIIIPMSVNYLKSDSAIRWHSYAWATAYTQNNSLEHFNVVQKSLTEYNIHTKEDLQLIVQTAYSCYPTQFTKEIEFIAQNKYLNEKTFATAINYLAKNNKDITKLLGSKFSHSNHPVIIGLRNEYTKNHTTISVNQLEELFKINQHRKVKILYSLQFKNRDRIGLAIIQKANGKFARTTSNDVFMVDQLARSITNMPAYISNGNTPVGVYQIEKLDISENKFIGPTPSFVACLPFETDPLIYFNKKYKSYSLQAYLKFFPKKWHENTIFQQAYWAGKSGRGEIHFHGTTIDPQLYKGKPFYPQTPSMGCLCTFELWDDNGNLLKSDQQRLVDAWMNTPRESGYAYVLEIEDMEIDKLKLELNEIINNIEK